MVMLWRAGMCAWDNLAQITLGLQADRDHDEKGHEPDHRE